MGRPTNQPIVKLCDPWWWLEPWNPETAHMNRTNIRIADKIYKIYNLSMCCFISWWHSVFYVKMCTYIWIYIYIHENIWTVGLILWIALYMHIICIYTPSDHPPFPIFPTSPPGGRRWSAPPSRRRAGRSRSDRPGTCGGRTQRHFEGQGPVLDPLWLMFLACCRSDRGQTSQNCSFTPYHITTNRICRIIVATPK